MLTDPIVLTGKGIRLGVIDGKPGVSIGRAVRGKYPPVQPIEGNRGHASSQYAGIKYDPPIQGNHPPVLKPIEIGMRTRTIALIAKPF